jgi:hypothetical protein
MSTRRRLDRGTAERLLCGEPVGPMDGSLANLLAAAAGPARDSELAGEQEAVTAFQVAHLVPATQLRRPSMMKTGLARLLALKVTLAAGAVAIGGVALAASISHSHTDHSQAPAAAAVSHSPAAAGASAEPKASPSPSMTGLCRAYNAQVGTSPGKALDSPAFTALVTAAGGKDKVAAFCTATLGAAAQDPANAHASARPASHPTGKPTASPDHGPNHPHGKPTSLPTP